MKFFIFFWFIAIVLLSYTNIGYADTKQHNIVEWKTKPNKKAKRSASKHTPSEHGVVRNLLYPFTLRVMYAPNYRFLTKKMRDSIEEANDNGVKLEVAQFFPITAGLEGEFAFNEWVSLAVGGSFSYHGKIMAIEWDNIKVKEQLSDREWEVYKSSLPDSKFTYHEFVVDSSLYFNVNNYFKIGAGVGLTFRNVHSDTSFTEKGNKYKKEGVSSVKRMLAHLALRRDFFLSRVGFGVGFNTILHFADIFDKQVEEKMYKDGKLQPEGTNNNTSNNEEKEKEEDDHDSYSVVLMPMIYIAF